MTITLNGSARDVSAGITVSALLEQLGLDAKTVVAQVNEDIVERVAFSATTIQDGDTVELIRFVGGG